MLLILTDSKVKPFIFMLSVKKQSTMAVCKVAITSGYTADEILNSSFCFTEIQFTLFLLMPCICILCYHLFCFQLPMTLPSSAFCPKIPETQNSHFGVKTFNDQSSFC